MLVFGSIVGVISIFLQFVEGLNMFLSLYVSCHLPVVYILYTLTLTFCNNFCMKIQYVFYWLFHFVAVAPLLALVNEW